MEERKRMKHIILFLLFACLSTSCQDQSKITSNTSFQEIAGRDFGKENQSSYIRNKIYRCHAPPNWHRNDPSQHESIADTTKALCEFVIDEDGEEIHITIHNFPTSKAEERIPPGAQVARWKRQFTDLDLTTLSVTPQSNGGFAGLLFEGSGILKGETSTVMAWGMQLGPEHYSTLNFHMNTSLSLQEQEHFRQLLSDYTIKAVGPVALVEKHRDAILAFARSFELIEEIPRSL
jgi:hypothetical protein